MALQWLSDNSVWIILSVAGVHLLYFLWAAATRRRILRNLQEFLYSLLSKVEGTSDLRTDVDPDGQVQDFLADIEDILTHDRYQRQREEIRRRLVVKSERRSFSRASRFETSYNVARAAVEIYPLLGILGTILAMAISLAPLDDRTATDLPAAGVATGDDASAEVAQGQNEAVVAVSNIVKNFGAAIMSTLVGLAAAIVMMLVNALLEPSFTRIIEYCRAVREAMRAAERALDPALAEGAQA